MAHCFYPFLISEYSKYIFRSYHLQFVIDLLNKLLCIYLTCRIIINELLNLQFTLIYIGFE